MRTAPEIPTDWTKAERWVWERIAAGEPANFDSRVPGAEALEPHTEKGWGEDRRVRAKFLQSILTRREFVEAMPFGGVRIVGALIDDEPVNLEHARLQHELWLESTRILTDFKCRSIRVDGGLSLENSFVTGLVDLSGADVTELMNLCGATFKNDVILRGAKVGADLEMNGSSFEGAVKMDNLEVGGILFMHDKAVFKKDVSLHSANVGADLGMNGSSFEGTINMENLEVDGRLFMRDKANFKKAVILNGANVGGLEMDGSSFEGAVRMDSLRVEGNLFMRDKAVFKNDVILNGAKVDGQLDMSGSSFEGAVRMDSLRVEGNLFMRDKAVFKNDVILNGAKVGGQLAMTGSSFGGPVRMDTLGVERDLFMRDGANFRNDVLLTGAKVGGNLDLETSTFVGIVDLTGCRVSEVFVLAVSEFSRANWGDSASLTLRNTHVGVLQDWWRSATLNAWPKTYQLGGFTYDRLGWIGEDNEAKMLTRPVTSYVQWLGGDPGCTTQPYECLARLFHEAGDPYKSNTVLYAAREQRRSTAWSTVKDYRDTERREWLRALSVSTGLWLLRATIGYGLGNRYFRILWWVFALTILGAVILIDPGAHKLSDFPKLFFASLDQLLPIITLDKAHEALIFGDRSVNPPVKPQPYGVLFYFYLHTILGWVIGSFLVAGLAGLTQRN